LDLGPESLQELASQARDSTDHKGEDQATQLTAWVNLVGELNRRLVKLYSKQYTDMDGVFWPSTLRLLPLGPKPSSQALSFPNKAWETAFSLLSQLANMAPVSVLPTCAFAAVEKSLSDYQRCSYSILTSTDAQALPQLLAGRDAAVSVILKEHSKLQTDFQAFQASSAQTVDTNKACALFLHDLRRLQHNLAQAVEMLSFRPQSVVEAKEDKKGHLDAEIFNTSLMLAKTAVSACNEWNSRSCGSLATAWQNRKSAAVALGKLHSDLSQVDPYTLTIVALCSCC
jgi:hypothetical protein